MKKVKNLKVRALAFTLAFGTLVTVSGCSKELAAQEDYDIVQSVDSDDDLSRGLVQTLDVPGQKFKLITEYACDDEAKREWRITSDKFLYFNAKTEGLPEGTEVYIDNIHIDTSIKSKYASVDGIIQDTMDDHVHSSQLIGFPISDTTMYYGVNAVEGSNETFIKGTVHAYNGYYGYTSSTITEKRFTESDYKYLGVYANKIQIVYDLLVKGPNDKDFSNVSVSTDFLVPITNAEIKYENSDGEVVKQKTK